MEIGLRKRWRGSDAFIIFGVLAWMPVDMQMNDDVSMCMCSGFPTGISKQTIVTRISHPIEGGNYKRRAQLNLGLSSGSSDTEPLGLLTSHRPSTVAISV